VEIGQQVRLLCPWAVAKQGGSGGDTLPQCRRPWGRISTLFAVIKKRLLSRNLDQSILKHTYFWKKNCKNRLSARPSDCFRRLGAPAPDPRFVTTTYYYRFITFIFSAKCVLFFSK